MTPLVSVVVPVWNVERLLPRCLDSLVAQTHRPLEVIVVDDGSTDGSRDVMLAYHEKHPEVHVVTQRHRGIGPARNAGLSVAQGEYVFFVDADDCVDADFVSHLVGIAQSTAAVVVISGLWFHSGVLRAPFPFRPKELVISGEQAARRSLSPARMPSFVWNKLYRRDLFAGEPPFPSILYEDLATTPRILARAGTVALTGRAFYHYCLRSDSVTGEFGAKNVFSVIAALDILRQDLRADGRWEEWRDDYFSALRQMQTLIGLQTVFTTNPVPVGTRIALLRIMARRLERLAERPSGRRRLRPVTFERAYVRATTPGRAPKSSTIAVRGASPAARRGPRRDHSSTIG